MKTQHFLKFYYALAFLFGLFNIFVYLRKTQYLSTWNFQLTGWDYFMAVVLIIMLVLTMIVLWFVWRKKIEKIHLVYPSIFGLTIIWAITLNLVTFKIYGFPNYLPVVDAFSQYNILFYLAGTIIPLVVWKKMHRISK